MPDNLILNAMWLIFKLYLHHGNPYTTIYPDSRNSSIPSPCRDSHSDSGGRHWPYKERWYYGWDQVVGVTSLVSQNYTAHFTRSLTRLCPHGMRVPIKDSSHLCFSTHQSVFMEISACMSVCLFLVSLVLSEKLMVCSRLFIIVVLTLLLFFT